MAGIALPTLLWLILVFAPAPNPVQNGWVAGQPPSPYVFLQQPQVLLNKTLYAVFVSRFLVRDCGPITTALAVVGMIALLRGRVTCNTRWLLRWSAMGVLFYIILAPKMIDHDYYELMMLPAVAVWAALGCAALLRLVQDGFAVQPLLGPALAWRKSIGFALCMVLMIAVHSPWVSGGMFRLESGKVALGRALRDACRADGRVVALGPSIALIVPVHYSERAGWAVRATELPADWPKQVERWRRQGARVIGVYFDRKTKPEQRASYQPLIEALPVVDRGRRVGRDESAYEYYVLSLDPERVATHREALVPR
jgi:hypothetical protein